MNGEMCAVQWCTRHEDDAEGWVHKWNTDDGFVTVLEDFDARTGDVTCGATVWLPEASNDGTLQAGEMRRLAAALLNAADVMDAHEIGGTRLVR